MSDKAIKAWNEADRPREKLLEKGQSALTDAEIVAILLGSGTRKKSAVELAKEILSHYNNDLTQLARASLKELMQFKGVGEAKAISIIAAMELGKRKKSSSAGVDSLTNSKAIHNYLSPFLSNLPHEEFWVILLNKKLKPIRPIRIAQGGIDAVLTDVRLILKPALEYMAPCIILAHNHPSGQTRPSQADQAITDKIKNAASLMDITVIDHLIFTENDFYSFFDHGKL